MTGLLRVREIFPRRPEGSDVLTEGVVPRIHECLRNSHKISDRPRRSQTQGPLGAGSVSKETLSPCALNTLAPLAFAFSRVLESEGMERLI